MDELHSGDSVFPGIPLGSTSGMDLYCLMKAASAELNAEMNSKDMGLRFQPPLQVR